MVKILSPGEKIKLLRKRYKVNQKILAEGIVSVSMLSYIENNTHPLKEEIAKELCERLNLYIKNEKEKISYTDIFRSKKNQIDEMVRDIIVNIKKIDNNKIEEIKEIFSECQFPYEKCKVFFVAASYCKAKLNKNKTSIELFEEILGTIVINDYVIFLLPTIIQLQRLYSNLENFKLVRSLYMRVKEKLKKSNLVIEGYILYNFAVAFQAGEEIVQAIKLYEEALAYMKGDIPLFYVKNNLAICYRKNNDLKKSNNVLEEILELDIDDFFRAKCYSNILINSVEMDEKYKIKFFISKLERILKKLENTEEKSYQIHYCLGRTYLYLEDRYNAMLNFEKELALGVDSNLNHFFIDQYEYCIKELMKIYNDHDLNKFQKLEKNILKIPKNMFRQSFSYEIFYKFSQVYPREMFIEFTRKLDKKFNSDFVN